MPQPLALLCGLDGAHHFEDLWAAGFSVERYDSEYELVRCLAYGKSPDLICVLESSDQPVDEASLALVKRGTSAPLVLFRFRVLERTPMESRYGTLKCHPARRQMNG